MHGLDTFSGALFDMDGVLVDSPRRSPGCGNGSPPTTTSR